MKEELRLKLVRCWYVFTAIFIACGGVLLIINKTEISLSLSQLSGIVFLMFALQWLDFWGKKLKERKKVE